MTSVNINNQTVNQSNKNLPENAFAKLGLSNQIVEALTEHGYTFPTKVQVQAIPVAIEGRDLIVSSPTGSGKTAAFMLPAIQRLTLGENKNSSNNASRIRHKFTSAKPKLLVLTPTRELAVQVKDAAENYGRHLRRLRTTNILGGVSYHQQLNNLKRDPEIIVATPGRLIDFLQRRCIDLSNLSMLVLDEADRMLDMGFIDDIEKIISYTPKERQTLLFSATIDNQLTALTNRLMNNPLRVEVKAEIKKQENIVQSILWADDIKHKDLLLSHLLNDTELDQAIIFTATKNNADVLAARLSASGITTAALHGNLPQHARTRTLSSLRSRRLRVLVATDIAARGIDIPGITHVFNYDLPKFAEDYVHRIGRTGRAGRTGIAVSLVEHGEMNAVKRIERFTRQTLSVNIIKGLEPKLRAPSKDTSRFSGGRNARFTRTPNNQDRRGSNKRSSFRGEHESGLSGGKNTTHRFTSDRSKKTSFSRVERPRSTRSI